MGKYSTLLFSPSKYHHIGPFRFPIYEDLVPGEARGIEELTKKQSKSTFKAIKLAQRIAKDKGISTKEATELLGKVGNDENNTSEIVYDYAEELEELQNSSVGMIEQRTNFVTLFMRYRGEAQLDDSDTWTKLSDWQEEDTDNIPSKMLEEIFNLVIWERDGWPKEGEQGKNDQSEAKMIPRRS